MSLGRKVIIGIAGFLALGFVVDLLNDDSPAPSQEYEFATAVDACEGMWGFMLHARSAVLDDRQMAPDLRAIAHAARDVDVAQAAKDLSEVETTQESSDTMLRFLRRCVSLGWDGPTDEELATISEPMPAP